MMKRCLWQWLVVFSALLTLGGCATDDESTTGAGDEPLIYVPEGKADDYRSTKGKEYAMVALDTVVLTGSDLELEGAARNERARELIELRFKAVSYFAYEYLAGKSRDAENFEYGNFRTTVRQQTFAALVVDERSDAPGTFDFIFEAEAAGPNDLLSKIPLDRNTFALQMPKLSNSELEAGSYTRSYRHFDASEHDAADLISLDVEISAKSSEPDAYPEYARLFEDGVLDIAIHVGGGYNEKRYDLLAAGDIFDRLKSDINLKAPVDDFASLTSKSGAFIGSFDSNGREIQVEVHLIHPGMEAEEGVGYNGLLDLYRESASKRDIVIYDGHAGYDSNYSGVVVHYNPRYAIAADDFTDLELPEKYQLFFFNGCKTYTTYADAMYQHPKKDTGNLDIITTVNFSWLSEMTRVTTDFLGNIISLEEGTHIPRSYDQILAELNRGRSWDVIYGIHGLSDNGRLSPYADTDALCRSCEGNSGCPGADNLCIRGLDGDAACAAACTDDSGCPTGYRCSAVAASGSELLSGSQCVPTKGACE